MEREQPQREVRGWSWVQVFFIGMISLLIARYSIRFYDTHANILPVAIQQKYYPGMKFNSSTLYPTLYISDDERTITNRPTPYTQRVSSGPSHLHRYTGVILNNHLTIHKKMLFEVLISYKVVSYEGRGILFEIGFEEKEEIDKHLFLRDAWGTVYVRVSTCNNLKDLCLSASDGKVKYYEYILSAATVDTWHYLWLGFHMFPDDDVIKVVFSVDKFKQPVSELYRFINADINDNKWPVFAMYNPHMFQVHMKLTTVKNIIFDSSTVHPMIYISDNDREISNVPTKTTFRRSYRVGQLQKYEGVIANLSFDEYEADFQKWPRKVYFNVKLDYNVTWPIGENYLFEIGMSRLKYVDKTWTVGSQRYALSVYGSSCKDYEHICLISRKDGVQKLVDILSSSKVGTRFQGVFKFQIDFEHKTISVSSSKGQYTFGSVDMTEPMWPVFAMYKHSVDTSMTLNGDDK